MSLLLLLLPACLQERLLHEGRDTNWRSAFYMPAGADLGEQAWCDSRKSTVDSRRSSPAMHLVVFCTAFGICMSGCCLLHARRSRPG
jgi:hypothetical protein